MVLTALCITLFCIAAEFVFRENAAMLRIFEYELMKNVCVVVAYASVISNSVPDLILLPCQSVEGVPDRQER